MAEGMIRHLLAATWEPASAGTDPRTLNPLAVVVMHEVGVDMSDQWSKGVDDVVGDFDLAITLCGGAAESCPFFPRAAETLHVGFDDPAAATGTDDERLAAFRRVRDQLKETLVPLLLRHGPR
jgi:arsenate reductase